MAVTKGQGNPNWTREETALALELYFSLDEKIPPSSNKEVEQLSDYLRSMEVHKDAEKNESFRNPDGIVFKIGNIKSVATGKGFKNTSKMDQTIWDEFGSNLKLLKDFCALIRSGVETLKSVPGFLGNEEDDFEFDEGRILTRVHRTRERNRSLRKKLIDKLQKADKCHCEMCSVKPQHELGDLALRMFECHHVIPVSESVRGKTKLSDLSLLCANCHRLIHAVISREKRWLKIEEASKFLSIGKTLEQ